MNEADGEATLELRPIDRIRRAFRRDAEKVAVPEWEMDVYFHPLTIADQQAVASIVRRETGKESDPMEENIQLLILKARDEQGKPLFVGGDAHFLKTEADARVINRVSTLMYLSGSLSQKEAKDAVEG